MLAGVHYLVRREVAARRKRLAQIGIVFRAYRHAVREDVDSKYGLLGERERDLKHLLAPYLLDGIVLDCRSRRSGECADGGEDGCKAFHFC